MTEIKEPEPGCIEIQGTHTCSGEIIGIDKRYDSVCLAIFLTPEDSIDPAQIFEWKIGTKVKVIE